MWERDHTLWRHGESAALGWLDLPESMPQSYLTLSRLPSEVAAEGVTRVVLIGMGGSSLASLALASVFGPQPGFPELTVLDSTVPAWVRRVSSSLDPASTIYVVSSKSGDTTETDALYRHFRARRGKPESAGRTRAAASSRSRIPARPWKSWPAGTPSGQSSWTRPASWAGTPPSHTSDSFPPRWPGSTFPSSWSEARACACAVGRRRRWRRIPA